MPRRSREVEALNGLQFSRLGDNADIDVVSGESEERVAMSGVLRLGGQPR